MGLIIKLTKINDSGDYRIDANGVDVGMLSTICGRCVWLPGLYPDITKFSIRDENRCRNIVRALVEFQTENGFSDLYVSRYSGHIGTFFPENVWQELGFVEDENPDFYVYKKKP